MKKKIVIISYYFTPTIMTAINRSLSWFKFFPKHNIYPIILTIGTPDNYGVEKTEFGEIHRIKATELYSKRIVKKKLPSIIKLLLSKLYSITTGISKYDKTYKDFNTYFTNHLSKKCEMLIITGGPFILFRVGYTYAKKTKKKWIADYRDMWHLSDLPKTYDDFISIFFRNFIGLKVEKRWVDTAYKISVVTAHYIPKLKKITNTQVLTIENGFFIKDFKNAPKEKKELLTFVYPGTLYKSQNIELTIHAIKEACEIERYNVQLVFIGTEFHSNLRLFIKNLNSDYLTIRVTPKIPKQKAVQLQSECHMGVMCSYGVKGNPSSKLYEFMGMKQPVLLYPTDNDIIENRLKGAGLGYSYNTHQEAVLGIKNIIKSYKKNGCISTNVNNNYIGKYSRENLADLYFNLMLKDI